MSINLPVGGMKQRCYDLSGQAFSARDAQAERCEAMSQISTPLRHSGEY